MRRIFFALIFLIPAVLLAEGYQINLQGARQTGMGHTGTGLNFGSSSIHFNPGALAFMESKVEFTTGGSVIFSNNTFQKQGTDYSHQSDNPSGTPFFFYAAAKVASDLVAGLGITTPFGNSLVWGDDWDGRYLIQDISLAAIYFQPTLSYRLNDKFSVGAGLVYAVGNVDLHKALPVQDSQGDGQAELSGKTDAFGFNAGIFYQVNTGFSLGLSYRSTINMEMTEGDASFSTPASLALQFPDTHFKAALPMPGGVQLGAGWQVNDKLLLAADLQYVLWSEYSELSFDFEAETVPDSYSERNFENTLIYRVGAEYVIQPKITSRIGFAYDSTPIPEGYLTPETPGANKLNYTFGLSYHFAELISLDFSLQYIDAVEREDGYAPDNFYGTYNANALIPGIGVNINF
jgi:long-chain fatty acid transport protein